MTTSPRLADARLPSPNSERGRGEANCILRVRFLSPLGSICTSASDFLNRREPSHPCAARVASRLPDKGILQLNPLEYPAPALVPHWDRRNRRAVGTRRV